MTFIQEGRREYITLMRSIEISAVAGGLVAHPCRPDAFPTCSHFRRAPSNPVNFYSSSPYPHS